MSRSLHADPSNLAMFGHNPSSNSEERRICIAESALRAKKEKTEDEAFIVALCDRGFSYTDALHYVQLSAKENKSPIDANVLKLMDSTDGRITYISAYQAAKREAAIAAVPAINFSSFASPPTP